MIFFLNVSQLHYWVNGWVGFWKKWSIFLIVYKKISQVSDLMLEGKNDGMILSHFSYKIILCIQGICHWRKYMIVFND